MSKLYREDYDFIISMDVKPERQGASFELAFPETRLTFVKYPGSLTKFLMRNIPAHYINKIASNNNYDEMTRDFLNKNSLTDLLINNLMNDTVTAQQNGKDVGIFAGKNDMVCFKFDEDGIPIRSSRNYLSNASIKLSELFFVSYLDMINLT